MASLSAGEDLIDVVVRLPRRAVEDSLLVAMADELEAAARRLRDAKATIASLRLRSGCFNGIRFYDPNWEMILALYVAAREDRSVSVSELCHLSGGSTTTALRHIENLEDMGYIRREPDEHDRRRANVTLTTSLREATEAWLDLQSVAARVGG